MMALANLLHHPSIGSETMNGLIGGREIKRSNKDLGRVLALAQLSEARQEDSLLDWPKLWSMRCKADFPASGANSPRARAPDFASFCLRRTRRISRRLDILAYSDC
jgi:hypothetical protein